jgi:hypothetical protein
MNKQLLVNPKDLSLTESALNKRQLQLLLKRTPENYVRTRPAKGGGTWKYVTGGYVRKVLNLMFGFDWSFEVTEQNIMHGEAIVKGRLTVKTAGKSIVKEDFGNKEIICKKGSDQPLSIGNDLKAAATDCLKRCAAQIGIAADIYSADEFREVAVKMDEVTKEMVSELYEIKNDAIDPVLRENVERILRNDEKDKYETIYEILQAL